jgi:hypothetical protein
VPCFSPVFLFFSFFSPRIVLDTTGGAHLLGRGGLLYKQGGGLIRVQSPLVSKEELGRDLRLA